MPQACLTLRLFLSIQLRLALSRLLHPAFFTDTQTASGPLLGSEEADALAVRLLDTYGNAILRLAYSYLHNLSDAEEILQDTLMQYFRKAPTLESPRHQKAWLLRVAANLSKNRIEYNTLRKTDELEDSLITEHREDLSFVWEAVKALPPKYRETIHLFYHEGCSTAEIADILHMKETTVRSHLQRGRAKLKEILKEAYDF